MYGRNGEAPVPVVAPQTPADCFDAAIEAARIAVTYRTPVFLLSDGYLANGREPWRIPEIDELPDLRVQFAQGPNHTLDDGSEVFWPYKRDEQTLARPWAIPGTPGLEHRIGGIEKQDGTGNISYDPANHDFMVRTRQAKIDGIRVPDLVVDDPDGANTLVLGWGSTYGPITAAVRRIRAAAAPSPRRTCGTSTPSRAISATYSRATSEVLIPEMNLGPARHPHPRQIPGRRRVLHPGQRHALQGRAARVRTQGGQRCPLRPRAPVAHPEGRRPQSMKDFKSDQEVRWCPGCGDYAVLAAVQGFMPELGLAKENIVFVSGIGCCSRFPYYMNTYGMHSIHGRAPAIATGLASSRRDLSVWVVTGDGDALSIGGNHLIHALRRNVNLKILLFNNRIYGLTKGQYSPTSEVGKITKSTPMGSLDAPFNPVSLAIGAEASFVARTVDSDRKHLTDVLRQAAAHPGTALVEIYQNCNIFNDGAFEVLKDKQQAEEAVIRLEHGQPIRFGVDGARASSATRLTGDLKVVAVTEDNQSQILVHDAHAPSPTTAFALSRLADPDTLHHTPIGVLRSVDRPVYDTQMSDQLDAAIEQNGKGDLAALLAGNDTWTVVG